VVKLTDAEAIEAQCVENLQREDIHPLEEALGFKSLLDLGEPVYTIATIAARAGKSEAYVYGRTRLADLIPPVAEAFLKDQITIGHALLIAKLPASQQPEAFSAAFRGLWTSEGNSQVLIPVRELAAWIESNILLQLASAPFDKQDETLVPEAGSCANCPKRTGFNKLLFPDVRKDSCTSPDCFRAKIDACVKKTLETKPQLIQISAAWNSREGAPLGRNRYVELEIKKPKPNGASTKLSSVQKPCDKMTEAIVMDGGKRGQVVKVCADPTCRVHHPDTPSPQQVERERAEERKRIEKEQLAITTRHRILATILQRVSAPLKRADLLAVAHYLIGHLSYSHVPALAKRHKVEVKKDSASAQELLSKQVGTYDESELCKLLLEISLLDSAYQRSTASRDDILMDAAKRYRVDAEKLQKAVAVELSAKREKKTKAKAKPKARKTAA
jgi:ParB family chromosome partitioning protein